MPPPRPMLDDLELQQVQRIDVDGDQVLVQHGIPALEGDFFQGLGRRGTQISLTGVLTGADAAQGLRDLREKFRAAAPVDFVADVASAVRVDRVLIEEMHVRDLAGKPERFEYAFKLREYTPASPPREVPPSPGPEPLTTSLTVEVIVVGQPGYDYSKARVTVSGRRNTGVEITDQPLTNREHNVWTEEEFPPGSYRVRAQAPDPVVEGAKMVNEVAAEILEGEHEVVTIPLAPGQRRNIALADVVHYWFDNAFVEPCMRPVLRDVARRAASGGGEHLMIVGHTDLVGSDDYNRALSERRARGVHAYLTFGNDADAAVAEWNELRKARTVGVALSLNDTWGVREYQYMLQALCYHKGPIDETHVHGPDDDTDQAVRAFQRDNGLDEDGIVGDETWPVLIRAYLALDALSLDEDVFVRNSRDACDGGPLRWIGCGEKDPVKNTQDAWRPNRRTEILFVRTKEVPGTAPRPVTWDIRPDGSPTPQWCLGPGDAQRPCPFTSRGSEQTDAWLVQPARPERVLVSGRITHDDGVTAYATRRYSLLAPDGEYLRRCLCPDCSRPPDCTGQPAGTERADLGEYSSPGDPRRGRPIYGRTDADGRFSHPVPTPVGTYILELFHQDLTVPQVVRRESDPPYRARGNVICLDVEAPATPAGTVPEQRVIIQAAPADAVSPNPGIALAAPFVAVNKPHTNPQRVQVTLSSDSAFEGTGTLTRSGNTAAVRLFIAATGGTELRFDGTDNRFTGAELAAGVHLFAEGGPNPSGTVGDHVLTLTLAPSGDCAPSAGPPATASLTAVLFTLDIALSRPSSGVEPAIMSEADKVTVGRHVQVRDATLSHERTMLIVRPPTPAVTATLELARRNGLVQAFDQEQPASGQAPVADPLSLASAAVPAAGRRLFVEGITASGSARDTGYVLRVRELASDVDRVAITTMQLEIVDSATATASAATFVRIGLWDHAFDTTSGSLHNAQAEAANFVGADSRHFFLRVRDAAASGEVQVAWRTVFASTGADDDARAQPDVTLTESSAASHVFLSRALMLVTSDVDRNQATHSGLSAGHADAGLRTNAQRNHRLRRTRIDATHQLDSATATLYGAAGPAPQRARITAPAFRRTPEDRRRVRVHLVNVRRTAGGTGILTAARRDQVIGLFQSIYGVCGIYAEVDEIMLDPPASCIGWPVRYPADPIAVDPSVQGFSFPGGTNLVPSATQTAIINAARALPAFAANDIYVVCVARVYSTVPPPPGPGLVSGGGEAFPDSWTAAGSTARGFSFVGVSATNVLAEVHEVTHITTNLRNVAGGHFDLGAATATTPGPIDGKNLMHRFALIFANAISDSRRLWNTSFTNTNRTPNLVIPAQIDAIRASRFVHNY